MVRIQPIGTIGATSTEGFQQTASQPVSVTIGDVAEDVGGGVGNVAGGLFGGLSRGLISTPLGALAVGVVVLFVLGQLFNVQVG